MKLGKPAASIALVALLLAIGLAGSAPASAAPVWNIDLHHHETHFPPGGTSYYAVDVDNVGDTPSSGPITVTLELPEGITRKTALTILGDTTSEGNSGPIEWSCPGPPGASTVTCASDDSIGRHQPARSLVIVVDIDPSASGEPVASAKVEGGGAASGASTIESTPINSDPAGFGVFAPSFLPDFYESDGISTDRRAGGHPDLLVFPFDFNSAVHPSQTVLEDNPEIKDPSGYVRDLKVNLPPGFVGAPTAVGECSQALFAVGECPPASQVGRFDVIVTPIGGVIPTVFQASLTTGVFNLSHPRGFATDIAININANPAHIKASLDPSDGYAIATSVSDINETYPVFSQKLTLWGTPGAASHDSERCPGFTFFGLEESEYPGAFIGGGGTKNACPTDFGEKPFITLPAQCQKDNKISIHSYDSWQNKGVFGPKITRTLPGMMEDCPKSQAQFRPTLAVTPTGDEANTPTGLDVSVQVPQNESADARATPPIKSTVVTLPEGMAVSPSFADGLVGCSQAQIGLGTDDPVACPDNSRIGEVRLSTPLLPGPAEGSLYLAKQGDNPFGSLLGLYLVMHDTEERGVLVKVAGRIDLDSQTGRITTSFDDLPQFPFEDLTLKFRSGPRAPLVAPPTCGSHRIEVKLTSYAQPNTLVDASSTFPVSKGPGGGPCVNDATRRPFAPTLLGGTLNPAAGTFSPLSLRVTRSDADQELAGVEGITPTGLTASLRGVTFCPEAQIALAQSRGKPGQGALEQAQPSCPASSQVGTVETGAGAGPNPIYVPGKVYLAGPYKGAPLSGVAIVPAMAGPVDLGVVIVRAAAYLDPVTAQVRLRSDTLPQIVNGVLIRVRDVRIRLDRPNFTLNPTSCAEKSIGGIFRSTFGASAEASSRFQVGECDHLGFKPRLNLRLRGGAARGAHPRLRAILRPRPGDANLASATVRFPRSAFLDQAHIRTLCTRVQFAADACPKGSVYGNVSAFSPLLEEPLTGSVYLRSSNHLLPDVVFDLHGIVDFEASARVDSVKGALRVRFGSVPDVPVSKVIVDMQGGNKGLLVNSRNLCAVPSRAKAQLGAHNNRRVLLKPLVRADC